MYYFLLISSFLDAQIIGIILRRISFTLLVQYGELAYMYRNSPSPPDSPQTEYNCKVKNISTIQLVTIVRFLFQAFFTLFKFAKCNLFT